jgi:membrane-associated phospholipid phosphatase
MNIRDLDRRWSARISLAADIQALRGLSLALSWIGSFLFLSGLFIAYDLLLKQTFGSAPAIPPAWKMVLHFVIVGIVVFLAKQSWRRPRPMESSADRGSLDRYSFPSGHAARMGVIILLAPGPLALAGAVAIMLARICLKRHYLSDVLAGFLMGLLSAFLLNLALAG